MCVSIGFNELSRALTTERIRAVYSLRNTKILNVRVYVCVSVIWKCQ